ncbi:MAG: glycosyl transferase [Acidiferrobacteraceae bacterium]|nr:glycosyl transferase [Acidiferrobacteraceae bacterium]
MEKIIFNARWSLKWGILFDVVSLILMCAVLIVVSVSLLIGNAPIAEYLKNDLLTESKSVAFLLSWVVAYVAAWTTLRSQSNHVRFDWISKVILVSAVSFLVVAMVIYFARIPFLSRAVFFMSLSLAIIGNVVIFEIRGRLFKSIYGVFLQDGAYVLPEHHGIQYRDLSGEEDYSKFSGVVVNLDAGELEEEVRKFTELQQSGANLIDRKDWFELVSGRILLSEVRLQDLERVKPPRLYIRSKRVLDGALVLVMAPFIVPLGLLIGLAIKIESSGPIFFRQMRIGLHGKEFIMYKFRSMSHSSEAESASFAGKGDVRVTRVGKIMRRYRLDELPQVLNVLKGQMSLIGPRPEQPEIVSRYLKSIPFYGFRHVVRPGISGWAQVVYHYAASDEETMRKLEYDFFYIKNMSLWLDFVVLLRTTVTMMLGKGAR